MYKCLSRTDSPTCPSIQLIVADSDAVNYHSDAVDGGYAVDDSDAVD